MSEWETECPAVLYIPCVMRGQHECVFCCLLVILPTLPHPVHPVTCYNAGRPCQPTTRACQSAFIDPSAHPIHAPYRCCFKESVRTGFMLPSPAFLCIWLAVCPYQWCQQDDIMFPAGQRASQPTLAVCLLRDYRKSQRNIHSVRLGKPISYFSPGQSGLERLSQSLFFCLPYCCTSLSFTCTLSTSASHFICHLSAISSSLSLQIVLYLSLAYSRFTSPCFILPLQFFPSLPSAMINHNEREILHWKPGRARDIYPVLAGQDGEDYKYCICLAVNIFIRG